MNDAHNDEFDVRVQVHGIITIEMYPQPRGQAVPSGSHQGRITKRLKYCLKACHKSRGVLGGVFGDEGPNIGEVVFGGIGYSQGSEAANRCLPLRAMRVASKS